jgi:hypothetical protein
MLPNDFPALVVVMVGYHDDAAAALAASVSISVYLILAAAYDSSLLPHRPSSSSPTYRIHD